MSRNRILLLLLILICVQWANGQYAIDLTPRVSSDNSISERVAYTRIAIEYGSPKVQGRTIWGDLEEFDQIWRAGANMATTIAFSEDVTIENAILPKGVYSLFVIPREQAAWTIIFNNVAEQWGAFNYDEAEDALRIEVPATVNNHVEDLTFDIIAKGFEGAYVTLEWEKIKLSFFVEVEHIKVMEQVLENRLKTADANIHWVLYLQAANYLIDQENNLELADKWLKMSHSAYNPSAPWSGQYYPQSYILGDQLWAEAKLAALKGDFKSAINHAAEMKRIEGDYLFHVREKESENIDSRIQEWQEQVGE